MQDAARRAAHLTALPRSERPLPFTTPRPHPTPPHPTPPSTTQTTPGTLPHPAPLQVRHDAKLASQSEHAPPSGGAAAAELPQLGQGLTDISAGAELQARVAATPEAYHLSRHDVLRLYSSPGYSEDEAATDRELIEQASRHSGLPCA